MTFEELEITFAAGEDAGHIGAGGTTWAWRQTDVGLVVQVKDKAGKTQSLQVVAGVKYRPTTSVT